MKTFIFNITDYSIIITYFNSILELNVSSLGLFSPIFDFAYLVLFSSIVVGSLLPIKYSNVIKKKVLKK